MDQSQKWAKFIPSKELLLLFPLLLFLTGFYLFPVAKILFKSIYDNGFTFEHIIRIFTVPLYFKVLIKTVKISLAVTMVCIVLGYPVAYLFYDVNTHIEIFFIMIIYII